MFSRLEFVASYVIMTCTLHLFTIYHLVYLDDSNHSSSKARLNIAGFHFKDSVDRTRVFVCQGGQWSGADRAECVCKF